MINENPHTYDEPVQVGAWWVVKQKDAVTAELTAEIGYATKDAAWSAYLLLSTPKASP